MTTIEHCGTFSEALAEIGRQYFAGAQPTELADAVAQLLGEIDAARALCRSAAADTAAATVPRDAIAAAAAALGAEAAAARAADAAACAGAADVLLGEMLARLPARGVLEAEAATLEAAVARQREHAAAVAAAREAQERAFADLVRETAALEAAVAGTEEGEGEEEDSEEMMVP